MTTARRVGRRVAGIVLTGTVLAGCALDPAATSGAPAQAPTPSATPASPTVPGSTAEGTRPPATTVKPTGSASVPASPTPSSVPHPKSAAMDAIVDAHLDQWYPNAIVGVWSPQGTWTRAVGTTAGRPVTTADHTRVGSVTKTFTTTLVLQLAAEKKLSLEDPIEKYVPGMPNPTATLRQLADMTSGIPSYTDLELFDDSVSADHARVWKPQELVDALRDVGPLWSPGAQYFYSNSNTVLLGMVVEKVTGRSLDVVLRERILTPLGLRQTSFPLDAELPEPYLSGTTDGGEVGHDPMDATHYSPSMLWAAGQMVSTLEDMHAWADALSTGHGILDAATQKARLDSLTTTVPGNSSRWSYGIGLQRHDGWLGHMGEVSGYTTMVFHKPETQTTMVVICGTNIYADNVERPAMSLFDTLSRELG